MMNFQKTFKKDQIRLPPQIDLERTEALRRTAEENHRTAAEREGERRTRHNSTLGEFLKDAVKRNSAS